MTADTISPLRQRMIEDMNARKLCAGTQRGHISSCKRFAGLPRGIKTLKWHEPVSENPSPDDIEVWAIYSLTRDAHPMHVHEVFFQVVDRQRFETKTGLPVGKKRSRRPEENGWKDTVIAYPGEITRIRMKFTTVGQFAWHCHIVEHEDNEMMRPYRIGPMQPGQPV